MYMTKLFYSASLVPTDGNFMSLFVKKGGKDTWPSILIYFFMGATEQLFRIIQSIPSPKAEPFKVWMAQVASSRLEQMQDPEKSIDQAIVDYKRLGYSDAWINQRIKSIEIRKELTDEWARTGVQQGLQYASLTDIITREWSGMTTKQYKSFKGLKKESLRDNMTNMEIALNMLAEASATELSKQRNRGITTRRQPNEEGKGLQESLLCQG